MRNFVEFSSVEDFCQITRGWHNVFVSYDIHDTEIDREICEWLAEHSEGLWTKLWLFRYMMQSENDAMHFKLRWG